MCGPSRKPSPDRSLGPRARRRLPQPDRACPRRGRLTTMQPEPAVASGLADESGAAVDARVSLRAKLPCAEALVLSLDDRVDVAAALALVKRDYGSRRRL